MADTNNLAKRIEEAKAAYYAGSPVLSDAAYDALEDELRKRDPDHYLLRSIGAPPGDSGWPKVKHNIPMRSLNKAQVHQELEKWWQSCQPVPEPPLEPPILVTEKLDGISVSLFYLDGMLQQALTRGDGNTGEDITRNVSMMKGAPHELKDPDWSGYLRGEIICCKSDFEAHFPGESNPRNSAAGTAKRQSNPEKCRHLTVKVYQTLPNDDSLLSKLTELEEAHRLGFKTVSYQEAHTPSDVDKAYKAYIDSVRAGLDYDIDGLVVEVNSNPRAEELGERNHRPKGAIAYKFPHETAETILEDVIWQVGNSGRITPVAIFKTVPLAGANVSRASLHNVKRFRDLNLFRGCRILVSRRNDVIPFVEENLEI